MKTSQIIKAIGCPHLSLFKGKGYWYFVYDTFEDAGEQKYETHSVYVTRLSDLSLESWVYEGKLLVELMK